MDNRQNALIEVEGLKKFYKNRGTGGLFKKKKMVQAVGGVSFEIRKGEIFGVIGESGCGKSTMGRTLVNLEAPTAGDVRINGESARAILQKDPKAFHQMVQMVFQNPFDTFLPTETIEQIMLRPLEINGLGGSEEERRRRIVQLLEDGGLSPAEDFLGRYPHELSGGQRQRASLARGLALKPSLLIADEPTSALDVSVQAKVLELFKLLQAEIGFACLFITHDLGVVSELCDTVIVMYTGHIVEQAPAGELFRDPKHPYTIGLLNAIPVITKDRKPLSTIEGMVPNPTERIKGCSFWPRCPHATERCRTVSPPMKQLSEERKVRCWLFEDQAAGKEA